MTNLLALSGGAIAGICVGGIALILLIVFVIIVPFKVYLTALFSGCYISAFKLISLKYRKVQFNEIVDAYIMAKRGKLIVKFNSLEAHHLAGGSCKDVVSAMLQAKSAGVDLPFEKACAIDLTCHDIVSAVSSVVTPKQLMVNDIKGVTRDNYELSVNANITVKAKLDAYVGGYSEETLQSKVTKYVVGRIGQINDHRLANPSNLSEGILQAGLDAKNGYQLLSCDIVSINTVRDIGAEFASKDLERIKIQAQIEADRQRNQAMIEAEQMKLRTEEMKTAVLEAEADVPRAIAEAIRDGRMSVMDYYKLMNLQADTAMRRAVIGNQEEPPRS